MTLDEVKVLLDENEYIYHIDEYENEKQFLEHIYVFPNLKEYEDCRVRSIVILCNNGYKNIEIQFNEIDGEFEFIELLFGEFCFDMFECEPEHVADDLMFHIYQIVAEEIAIITRNDLTKKKWLDDACFSLYDDDPAFGEPGFFMAVQNIQRPKSALEEKFTTKKQFEIYTANSYQCIIR